jgi:two-component system phosphate regulon sensor histidine kinase PhoR
VRGKLFILFSGLFLASAVLGRQMLALGIVVGLGSAALLAWAAPRLFFQSFADLVRNARRMAQGDLSVRSPVGESDPLAPLGRALDRLAGSLSSTMRELRTERDLMTRILERMEEGVMVLDGAGQILLINPALRDMLLPKPTLAAAAGEDRRVAATTGEVPSLLDVRGMTVLEVFRHAGLAALLDAASRDEKLVDEIVVEGLKPRRLLVRFVRFETPPFGYLTVVLDVTDIRRLESLRRDFVANASHELRTPITAVRSAAETLRTALTADPRMSVRLVDIIERNAERLLSLVEDLMELSRIESREFRLNKEPLDLAWQVGHALGLFRDRAEQRKVRLASEVPASCPPLIADRHALEIVLSNLLDNAVKYCPEGSSVVVRVLPEGERIRIQVVDSGPGISAEHLPRLFERFYRVDPGRSRDRGGTGLGLSIVKHLVEASGGQVTVESTVGLGTTFTVSLPRAPRPSPEVVDSVDELAV